MASDVDKNGKVSIKYPHWYNTSEALAFQREYSYALLEGLHRWYSNDDNELWHEGFMKTKEYQKIDSLNGGDWEDFYYYETPQLEEWYVTYGSNVEPSEEFKTSVNYGKIH